MNNNFETLMSVGSSLAALGLCAMVWIWAITMAERGIIETCDNYGSFVYEDVRYTCERVVK